MTSNNKISSKLYILIYMIILVINNNNIVGADDLNCLGILLNKAFNSNLKPIICKDIFTHDPDGIYMYKASCDNNTSISQLTLQAILPAISNPIEYQYLNCFDGLKEITLHNIVIKKDTFGVLDQKRVADNILLYSCSFIDGGLVSESKELPIDTSYLKIFNYNSNSNLKDINYLSIRNLKYFYLEISTDFPNIINDLKDYDITSFTAITLVSNKIPSLRNVICSRLELVILGGNSIDITSYSNLSTFNRIEQLTLSFNDTVEYPNELGSSSNVFKSLTLASKFKAPTGSCKLPDSITFLHISVDNPNFNINGQLPFVPLPSKLNQFYFNDLGLNQFPSYLPQVIRVLSIINNKFNSTLPSLSSDANLETVSFQNCGFIGTIPESYCRFNVYLNNNNLSGNLPQCKICYIDDFKTNFLNNSMLNFGTCEIGSVIPNLSFNSNTSLLILTGENLGLKSPYLIENQSYFTVNIRQRYYSYYWISNSPPPDTLTVLIGSKNYTMSTKNLTPQLYSITKIGNQFIFEGSNYSYNKSNFQVQISNEECIITSVEFNKIVCNISKSLPLSQDVPSTIRNVISNEFITFTTNTLIDKTTIVKQCKNICQNGICSSTLGQCICNQFYNGDDCSSPTPFLTSVSSTLSSGGLVYLYGWFGDQYNDLKVKIGSLDCKVNFVNSTYSTCLIGSGIGTHSVIITINSYSWTGQNMFHYNSQVFNCLNNCYSNGECDKSSGQCHCYLGWAGFDCNSKSSTSGNQNPKPDENPKSNTTIDQESGSTIITNQETSYEISIISLVELNINGDIVVSHNLTNKWISNSTNQNTNIHIFKQEIQDSCIITYIIEDIKERREYEFAGLQSLVLDKDSIKITISIDNYPFTNVLNSLQLRLKSSIDQNNLNNNNNNECNNKDTEIDTQLLDKNQLLNYIIISRNQKKLYGRFLNRVLSDNRDTFITTRLISNTKDSIIIGLNLPFFITTLTIDPDFSVLTSSSFKKCKYNGLDSWVVPVSIVVPFVSLVILVIIGVILYRRNRASVLVIKNKLKLKSLSKRKKDEL